ncbi:MAG: hypothetical protein ACLSA6_10740 [Holdemania massiliensis]
MGTLVFITTSTEHYADGFDVEAAHYLLKPVSWDAFCEAMRRVQNRMQITTRRVRVIVGRMKWISMFPGLSTSRFMATRPCCIPLRASWR